MWLIACALLAAALSVARPAEAETCPPIAGGHLDPDSRRSGPDGPIPAGLTVLGEDGRPQTLQTTAPHPFWTRQRGWTRADWLSPGDELFTSAGGWLRLTAATWAERTATVYNLEVADYHTYFAGDAALWAHNHPCAEVARGVGAAEDAGTVGRRFIVDPKGNALIEPPGGATVGNPAGTFVETRYPSGSPYQQLHSPRGEAPHGHGFLEGAGPNQRGPSLDVNGNVVPENAPAAHWPVD
ncbi:MAG: polymorphic toxin-type HINT domain-containing protein [Acidobacteriota bacterium]